MKQENIQTQEPPTKAERQRCYDARDEYWKCLDQNTPAQKKTSGSSSTTPETFVTPEAEALCQVARRLYEKSCPEPWVEHFDKKFRFEKWKIEQDAEVAQFNKEIKKKLKQ